MNAFFRWKTDQNGSHLCSYRMSFQTLETEKGMADNLVSQIFCCVSVKSIYLNGCKLHKKTILQKKTPFFFHYRWLLIKKLFAAGIFTFHLIIFMGFLLML
jgi:hypothetical protein